MSLRPHSPTAAAQPLTKLAIAFALALAAALATAGLAAGFGSFGASTPYGVGSNPLAVATGDFNRDGNTDVAAANSTPGSVSILLGAGNGTLGSAQDFGVGSSPHAILARDFNGDHKLDLVTADSGGSSVSFLRGLGNGGFAPAADLHTDSDPVDLAAADFNRDGRLDLAVANMEGGPWEAGSVSILLGKHGGFRSAHTFAAGPAPTAIETGRFNRDRKTDLVVLGHYGPVSVFPGNGHGGFGDGLASFAPKFSSGYAFAVGRFNGDRHPDLALSSCDDATLIMLGKGNGYFRQGDSYAAGDCTNGMIDTDVNRDRRADLVVPNTSTGALDLLTGHGNGRFTVRPPLSLVSGLPYGVASARLNGDRGVDLVAPAYSDTKVRVFLNLP